MRDLADPSARRLMIFSHPSHELGLLGLVQETLPHLVFISDGANPVRIDESRAGLEAAGAAGRATYLAYPEQRLYRGLLDRDLGLFREIIAAVREVVERVEPDQALCDAVEFYNPAHDIGLPIARAALQGCDTELLEVPLIFEHRSPARTYSVQRVVPSRREETITYRLTPQQLEIKRRARDEIYRALVEDLGRIITDIPDAELAIEEVRPADRGLREVPEECTLRYEYRGEDLVAVGAVERAVTLRGHYAPVAGALFEA